MTTSLRVTHGLSIGWNFNKIPLIGTLQNAGRLSASCTLSQGNSGVLAQANMTYQGEGVVTAGSPITDLNLWGVLQDVFEDVIDFATIKMLFIQNNGTPNGSGGFVLNPDAVLLVGGAGSAGHAWDAPFNGNVDCQLTCGAGDHIFMTNRLAGWPVANNSSNILRLQHSGTEDIAWTLFLAGVM
jgi:hypothetical protein